jgi:hypothetical protein
MQHCSTFQQVCSIFHFRIRTSQPQLWASWPLNWAPILLNRQQGANVAQRPVGICILVGVCYIPGQGYTYTRRRKKSSHRLPVAMKHYLGPSWSAVGDLRIASDRGWFTADIFWANPFIYGTSEHRISKTAFIDHCPVLRWSKFRPTASLHWRRICPSSDDRTKRRSADDIYPPKRE